MSTNTIPPIKIPVSNGLFALVDAADAELVSGFRWSRMTTGAASLFYAVRSTGKRSQQRMHVLIMNPPDGMVIDHRNGDGLDNRRENLRVCTQQQNTFNRKKSVRNSSGYIGVSWFPRNGYFVAQVKLGGKRFTKHGFDSAIDAAIHRDKMAAQYHGEFAHLNFPPKVT